MIQSKQALIVFARKPEPGKVKTRLAATIGNEKALAIYIKLLEHTKAITEKLPCDKHVFLTKEKHDAFWDGFTDEVQQGDILGDRMKHAFALLFDRGYENVLIIGTDCPGLTTEIVAEGFEQLKNNDVVIGPAEDGGYYLLGMNKLHASLFEDIFWSTQVVFQQTMEIIKNNHLSFHLLPPLADVDEEKDVPKEWL